MRKCVRFTLLSLLLSAALHADNARFDLTGPKIDVRVTRGGSVLPIAQVPNLQAGDSLLIRPDLPPTQSVHLLVVVAFLRGTTNPPPDAWFTRIESWDKKSRTEGVKVVVPQEAQTALIFIAPETGGDFSTLKSAVRGRPGIFVRAAADLNEASFEQSRIEHYLDAMRSVSPTDPKEIADHSDKLASTLNLKPNNDCLKQAPDQQVGCLRQTGTQSLLDDGHGQTIAATLSSGASSDFINAASVTPMAGAGVYSAYVGAIVDAVRLMSGLHTAQYQYIPAITFPQDATLNLKLNAAPSFHNPKSVIVVGLPAIQKTTPPSLRPHNPGQVSCLLQPKLALALEGAPLVFATSFAHDLVLHINDESGPRDLPLKPDAYEGGLVLDNTPARKPLHEIDLNQNAAKQDETPVAKASDIVVTGVVRGLWGFDHFEGPSVALQQLPGKDWKFVGDTQLYSGKENHLLLSSSGVACVQEIAIASGGKNPKTASVEFVPAPPRENAPSIKNALDLKVPMQKVDPGGYTLRIKQYGNNDTTSIPVTAYNGALKLDGLYMHKGDDAATLTGTSLNGVESLVIDGETFRPDPETTSTTSVDFYAQKGIAPAPGSKATVKLQDGRTVDVAITLDAARPTLKLLSSNSRQTATPNTLPVTFGNANDIPVNGTFVFVVQASDSFPRSEKIEIATADGSLNTTLSLAGSSLVLQDAKTAIATLDPLKAFGASAFGRLQMRPVAEDGTVGEWIDLGTLVRAPSIQSISCTTPDGLCTMTGDRLFLIESVAASADMADAKELPTGYALSTFSVPAPKDGKLYLKLRDDDTVPATIPVSGRGPSSAR